MTIDPNDLLPPDWQCYGYSLEKSIHPAMLGIYSKLKDIYPDIYVNSRDGKRLHNWCGLRSPTCAIGAPKSMHKLGMALDLHLPQLKINLLYAFCTSTKALAMGIRRVENINYTSTWVHIDIGEPNLARWIDVTKPYIFNP